MSVELVPLKVKIGLRPNLSKTPSRRKVVIRRGEDGFIMNAEIEDILEDLRTGTAQ